MYLCYNTLKDVNKVEKFNCNIDQNIMHLIIIFMTSFDVIFSECFNVVN